MRIITGSLRGRSIPFNVGRKGSVRLTSSMLKEAVFAMLGPELDGQSFLDLCAGSGQMGLEAISRGARAVLNEADKRRCAQIRGLLKQWKISGIELFCEKAQMLLPRLAAEGRSFDAIYLDPPYHATLSSRPFSLALLDILGGVDVLMTKGRLFVQVQKGLDLPEKTGRLNQERFRKYGDTVLATYRVA